MCKIPNIYHINFSNDFLFSKLKADLKGKNWEHGKLWNIEIENLEVIYFREILLKLKPEARRDILLKISISFIVDMCQSKYSFKLETFLRQLFYV